MPPIAYTVVATLPDEATAREYIDWLVGGHVQAVLAGGAESAQVVRLTDPETPIRVESRYVFPSRDAFETYERDHAPALREDGGRRFGERAGVSFRRRVGDVVWRAPRDDDAAG